MKLLVVGDIHATSSDLTDCRNLMDLVLSSVQRHQVAEVVFLGDQSHTHNTAHLDVLDFWHTSFAALRKHCQVTALVGNHDRSNDLQQTAHFMQNFEHLVTTVDRPFNRGVISYVPYIHTEQEFTQAVNDLWIKSNGKSTVLFCHATFQGCQYDNGFYAKDGFSLDTVPHPVVISGHIHTPNQLGKLTYPGAPRWMSLSDANTDRYLHVYELTETNITLVEKIPTDTHCRRIYYSTNKSGTFVPLFNPQPNQSWRVDVYGTSAHNEQFIKLHKDKPTVKFRVFDTTPSAPTVRESEGVQVAFAKYLAGYTSKQGTPTTTLAAMAKERLWL